MLFRGPSRFVALTHNLMDALHLDRPAAALPALSRARPRATAASASRCCRRTSTARPTRSPGRWASTASRAVRRSRASRRSTTRGATPPSSSAHRRRAGARRRGSRSSGSTPSRFAGDEARARRRAPRPRRARQLFTLNAAPRAASTTGTGRAARGGRCRGAPPRRDVHRGRRHELLRARPRAPSSRPRAHAASVNKLAPRRTRAVRGHGLRRRCGGWYRLPRARARRRGRRRRRGARRARGRSRAVRGRGTLHTPESDHDGAGWRTAMGGARARPTARRSHDVGRATCAAGRERQPFKIDERTVKDDGDGRVAAPSSGAGPAGRSPAPSREVRAPVGPCRPRSNGRRRAGWQASAVPAALSSRPWPPRRRSPSVTASVRDARRRVGWMPTVPRKSLVGRALAAHGDGEALRDLAGVRAEVVVAAHFAVLRLVAREACAKAASPRARPRPSESACSNGVAR